MLWRKQNDLGEFPSDLKFKTADKKSVKLYLKFLNEKVWGKWIKDWWSDIKC